MLVCCCKLPCKESDWKFYMFSVLQFWLASQRGGWPLFSESIIAHNMVIIRFMKPILYIVVELFPRNIRFKVETSCIGESLDEIWCTWKRNERKCAKKANKTKNETRWNCKENSFVKSINGKSVICSSVSITIIITQWSVLIRKMIWLHIHVHMVIEVVRNKLPW